MSPPDPFVFEDAEFSIRPSERNIDSVLRAAFAAGASQVLIRPLAPMALRIGSDLVRPGAKGLSRDFVDLLLGEILSPEERLRLHQPDAEVDVEIGVSPYATSNASVFLGGGHPSLLIRLPGIEAPAREAPPEPRPEDIRPPLPAITLDGCLREITDCYQQCLGALDYREEAVAVQRQLLRKSELPLRQRRLEIRPWLRSARTARKLRERLLRVTGATKQPEISLEMARDCLREGVEILRDLTALQPSIPILRPPLQKPTPVGIPTLLPQTTLPPSSGRDLIRGGFAIGASELLLIAGAFPAYRVGDDTKRPMAREITRIELEAILLDWEEGAEFYGYEGSRTQAFRLIFGDGTGARVAVERRESSLVATVSLIANGNRLDEGGEGVGVGALLPKNPPTKPLPSLRAFPPPEENAPLNIEKPVN